MEGNINKTPEENNGKMIAIFDIGSGSVGGGLAVFHEGGRPSLLFAERFEIETSGDVNREKLMLGESRALEKAVDSVSKKLSQFTSKNISSIQCFFSSPWSISKTIIVGASGQEEAQEPFTLKEKTISNVIDEEEKKMIRGNNFLPIERLPTGSFLNGYPVRNMLGRKAMDFKMFILLTVAEKSIIQSTRKIIGRHFNKKILFHSYAGAMLESVRSIAGGESSFLMVDVSGENTDISLIKNSVIADSVSTPFGKKGLIKEIAKITNLSKTSAISALKMKRAQKTEQKTGEKINSVLQSSSSEWKAGLEAALNSLSKESPFLPNRIFLTADPDITDSYADIIASMKAPISNTEFNVTILDADIFSPICDCAPESGKDSFLAIEAVSLNNDNL